MKVTQEAKLHRGLFVKENTQKYALMIKCHFEYQYLRLCEIKCTDTMYDNH